MSGTRASAHTISASRKLPTFCSTCSASLASTPAWCRPRGIRWWWRAGSRRKARRRSCSMVITTCSRPTRSTCGISPPFEPTIRDGRIFARGVADNKGQHLAQILAIESLLKVRGRLPCNVILLLEGEEEIGSPHVADFVREHRDLLKADFAVTADGPLRSVRPTDGQARLARRHQLRSRREAREPRCPFGQFRRRRAEPAVDARAPARDDEERSRRDHHRWTAR